MLTYISMVKVQLLETEGILQLLHQHLDLSRVLEEQVEMIITTTIIKQATEVVLEQFLLPTQQLQVL